MMLRLALPWIVLLAPACDHDSAERREGQGLGPERQDLHDPGFGDVAFKTYASGGTRLVFTSDTKVKATWANMAGPTAIGTYVKRANEIEIVWDPSATNYGSRSEKFRQLGPCSLARYVRVDLKGAVHETPLMFQQAKPRCDTVRVIR